MKKLNKFAPINWHKNIILQRCVGGSWNKILFLKCHFTLKLIISESKLSSPMSGIYEANFWFFKLSPFIQPYFATIFLHIIYFVILHFFHLSYTDWLRSAMNEWNIHISFLSNVFSIWQLFWAFKQYHFLSTGTYDWLHFEQDTIKFNWYLWLIMAWAYDTIKVQLVPTVVMRNDCLRLYVLFKAYSSSKTSTNKTVQLYITMASSRSNLARVQNSTYYKC